MSEWIKHKGRSESLKTMDSRSEKQQDNHWSMCRRTRKQVCHERCNHTDAFNAGSKNGIKEWMWTENIDAARNPWDRGWLSSQASATAKHSDAESLNHCCDLMLNQQMLNNCKVETEWPSHWVWIACNQNKNWAEQRWNQCKITCFRKWEPMTLNCVNKHYYAMKLQCKHIWKLKLKKWDTWKLLSMWSEWKGSTRQDFLTRILDARKWSEVYSRRPWGDLWREKK